MLGVDGQDLDARRSQQTLDLAHRGDEPLALLGSQRIEQRARELVRPLIERGALGATAAR